MKWFTTLATLAAAFLAVSNASPIVDFDKRGTTAAPIVKPGHLEKRAVAPSKIKPGIDKRGTTPAPIVKPGHLEKTLKPYSPPSGFNITSIGVNGSGCPAGSAYYVLSTDKTAVTVTFSNFYASAGPGVPITENRKACQISLGVDVPRGYSFAVATVDYRGYFQLDKGVSAKQRAIYYFQGEANQVTAQSTRNGPISGAEYTFRDEFAVVAYSPCGKDTIFNSNSAISVDNSGNKQGSGYIATDSVDTTLKQIFVTFSNYYASAGPGIAITENRKNCAITLGVHVPGGYTFAIATVDYRGFYSLDWKVKAIQSAIYYFQGQTKQATASSTRVGPIPGKDYLYRDNFDIWSSVRCPCGTNTVLNLNSAVRVDNSQNRNGFGYIATDSVDGGLKTIF
ncbi:hypothetical protein FRC17_002665, partial [Serendipita sp. 399]